MSAHTPGPWTLDKQADDPGLEPAVMDAASEFYVATAHDFGDSGETSQANARLIAAAPDMLAACEALLDRMTDGREEADAATLEEWSRDLRAAIAKARGGK